MLFVYHVWYVEFLYIFHLTHVLIYMVGISYKWCLVGDLRVLKFASEPFTSPGVPADPCERTAPMFFISEPFACVPAPIWPCVRTAPMSLPVFQCALVTTSVVVGDSASPILQLPWMCVEYKFVNIETCDQQSPCYYPCSKHLCDFIVVCRQKMADHLYYHTLDLYFPAHVYRLVTRFRCVNQVETPEYYDHTIGYCEDLHEHIYCVYVVQVSLICRILPASVGYMATYEISEGIILLSYWF